MADTYRAYQAWHCGNETRNCFGFELAETDDGVVECETCGARYDADTGTLLDTGEEE
jgi:nitrite reductase/ring-hydroxylating ferredoxin subunit